MNEKTNTKLCCGGAGVLRIWDVATGQCVYPPVSGPRLHPQEPQAGEGGAQAIVGLQLTGATLTVVTYDHYILQYSLPTLALSSQVTAHNLHCNASPSLHNISLSPYLSVHSQDGQAVLIGIASVCHV